MEAVVCQVCRSGLFQSEGLYLLNSGEIACSGHIQASQSSVYSLLQDPLVQLYAQLLAAVATFTQGNVPEMGQWVAPIEQSINLLSVQWVQMMKSQYCGQPSSWTCINCSFQNLPTNPICWQCRQPPGQKAAQPFQGAAPPVLADDVNVSADAWKCPREGCGQMHWITEKSCACGYQNLSLVESGILAEEEEKSIPAASPAPAVVVPMQYSIWVCPCGYEYNLEYMPTCQGCKRPKAESEKKEEIPRVEAQTWRCSKCGRDCAVGTKECFCGYSSEPQQSYPLPSQERKFWTCPSCQYGRNIESYTYCSNCQLKRIKEETYPNAYGPAMAAQVFPSFPGQSHAGQPESQVSRQAAGGKTHDTCLRCAYSNPIGQKCICWVCSNCGLASRGNSCTRCSTQKPSHLCRICQNKADESGLCQSCAARNGRQDPKGDFCFQCNSMNCTGAHQ